jgi:SAM-dependent methyltransferase
MLPSLYTTDAELYDIAFSWDVSEEIDWLVERLGGETVESVLEPACGSGRILSAFAARGIRAVGIDISPTMDASAKERLITRNLAAEAVLADMIAFDLDESFDGAVCPIDSLAHLLDPADVGRHLDAVAAHLRTGGKYFIQLELRDPADPWAGVAPSVWEAERGEVELRVEWRVDDIDLDAGVETQHSRIEIHAGPEAGRVFTELHRMAAWTSERWTAAVARSPFEYVAVYDGDEENWPRRPVGTSGRLLWHELAL